MTTWYSGLNEKGDIPSFIIILSAFLYVCYYFLDNLDGKQARKTQSSSPLGLLMDHGCDALTTFLFSMSIGSIIKLEGPFWFSMIWLLVCITFFFATWEEYQTDTLDLPCFNGVNEGTLIVVVVMLFTAMIGQDFWLKSVSILGINLHLNQILVSVTFLISLLFVLLNIKKSLGHKNTVCKKDALINIIVFSYLVFALIVTSFYSGCTLVVFHPKLLIYAFGFCFAKLVVIFYFIIGASTISSFM